MVSAGLPSEIGARRGTSYCVGKSLRSAGSSYRQRRTGRRVGETVDDRFINCCCCHWRWDPPSFRFTLRLRLLKGVFDAFQVCKPSVFRPISYLEKRAACRTSFAPAGTKRDLCRSRTRHQGFRTLLVVRELL